MALHDGHRGPDARSRCSDPAHRCRLSRVGRAALPRRSRPAVRRLSGGAAAQGAEGRARRSRSGRARVLPPADLAAERAGVASRSSARRSATTELASYLMYPKVLAGLRARPAPATATCRHPADPGVLLRHAAGRGDQRRPRARQDADRALCRDQRAARGRHAHGVLRAQRPAALGARAPTAARSRKRRAARARSRPATRTTWARRCRAPSRPSQWTRGQRSRAATCC